MYDCVKDQHNKVRKTEMTSFYSEEEVQHLGFHRCGNDVQISINAKFYGISNISLGDHVRIDDFCILSGHISIGSYVHIAPAVLMFAGDAGITLADYTGISSRCALYAATDDYSGMAMSNPTIPDQYRAISTAPIVLEKHVLVGTGCTVLPGVTLAEGTSVGAMSLLNRSTEPWGIYYGSPAKRQRERQRDLLSLCSKFEASII